MDNATRAVIALIKSAITGQKEALPDDLDLNGVLGIAQRHSISTMVYYGAANCGINLAEPEMVTLLTKTCENLTVCRKQDYAVKCIFEEFDKAQIDYLPLKGTVLRGLYPKPEMRIMGDADILIKTSQYSKIRPIMQELGYTEDKESNHELCWKKKGHLIELHKMLIPSYNKDYYAYFGDGWRLARKTETSRYEMSDEDNFIYMFTHYAKHYRDGGIGIRHLTDFYVFLRAKTSIDKAYIEKELKKLQLLDFYKNSMKTLSVWFDGAESDEMTDFMTARIIHSGLYGTKKEHIISSAVKTSKSSKNENEVKFKKIVNMIFIPYKNMKQLYPILKKVPILLPVMWIVRLVNAVFNKQDKIKKHSGNLKLMTTDNISKYQDDLNYVGLDFNFKE